MAGIDFEWDSKDFDKKFKELFNQNKNWFRSGARAVNRRVVKDVKAELRGRGYRPHIAMSFGDAGFMGKGNVSQAMNKDMSGKIWFSKNYYHMKFVEYGANVRWRHKRGNFVLPPRPSLTVKAREYWESDKARQIIEQYVDQQYQKKQMK